MYSKFGQFINGKWQPSTNKETYEVINPATEEIIGKASKASPEDVDKALKSAEKGFEIWKKTPPWQRSYIIRKIADLIRKKNEVLAKWLTLEVGKPLAEGLGEVNGAADIFEWNAEETKRIYGQTVESRFENTRIHVYYQPVGVVAALVPWNFPIVLAARKISTALAAGCSVICKPDVITPGCVMEMVDIIKEAGVPPGVVNLLSGDPASISSQLISSDTVKKISVTGSTRVGKLILKQASDKVQRVTMELSGHAPFIVFDDVDIKKVADMAIAAKFRNNGQVCISPSRFYIHETKKDDFTKLFVEKTSKLKIGNGLADEGNVVIVGRGSPIILSGRNDVFRVGLIANLEERISRVMKVWSLNLDDAKSMISRRDEARSYYVKRYFGVDDPDAAEIYHMVINTSFVGEEYSKDLIVEASKLLRRGRLL